MGNGNTFFHQGAKLHSILRLNTTHHHLHQDKKKSLPDVKLALKYSYGKEGSQILLPDILPKLNTFVISLVLPWNHDYVLNAALQSAKK